MSTVIFDISEKCAIFSLRANYARIPAHLWFLPRLGPTLSGFGLFPP